MSRMKTVEYGKQNPKVMILLHGGGLSWWSYREAAEKLAERFHVVLPVLDGHAESGVPFTSIEANAERIIQWVDERFQGHVLLMGGLSLGGQVLLEILSRRGKICDFAVAESALVYPMKLTSAMIRPAFAMCYPLVKKRWFARLQFDSLHIRKELFEHYYQDTARIGREDMIAFLTANAGYSLKQTLSGCSAKTLILVGSKERPIMKKSAKRLAQLLPKAELEVLNGCFHGEFSINHGLLYAEKLMKWINGNPAA